MTILPSLNGFLYFYKLFSCVTFFLPVFIFCLFFFLCLFFFHLFYCFLVFLHWFTNESGQFTVHVFICWSKNIFCRKFHSTLPRVLWVLSLQLLSRLSFLRIFGKNNIFLIKNIPDRHIIEFQDHCILVLNKGGRSGFLTRI